MVLQFTNNSLFDIIQLLKDGYIVCLHKQKFGIYYHQVETLEQITNEKLIFIDISRMSSLLNPEEWPWYIKDAGFKEYTSTFIVPTNPDNIFYYKL